MIKKKISIDQERGELPQLDKQYLQFTVNIILNSEKLKVFSLRSEIRQGYPRLSLFSALQWESWQMNKQEKEIEGILIGKEEIKLLLFTDDITVQKI